MKSLILMLFLGVVLTTGTNCQSSPKKNKEGFEFGGLTFYSSACNGTCPDITMSLTDQRQIQLIRVIYNKKGSPDTTRSGGFKGVLNEADFKKIVQLLSKIDWDTITFPDIQCCDLPVITLLVSYNNKNKDLKSMAPPESTRELISYLTELSVNISLPPYDKPMDFENVRPPKPRQ